MEQLKVIFRCITNIKIGISVLLKNFKSSTEIGNETVFEDVISFPIKTLTELEEHETQLRNSTDLKKKTLH